MTALDSGFRVIRFGEVEWEPRTEDEWPCLVKRQLIDEERDVTMRIVWYQRGAVEPRHVHDGTHAAVILVGSTTVEGHELGPWDAIYGPGGHPHGPLFYPNGCMLFALLSGGAFHTQVGPDVAGPRTGLGPKFIRERDLQWSPAGQPEEGWACERKILVADPERDYRSALLRAPRAAEIPEREGAGVLAAMILAGEALVDGRRLGPWDLIYAPGGGPRGGVALSAGTVLAVTRKGNSAIPVDGKPGPGICCDQ